MELYRELAHRVNISNRAGMDNLTVLLDGIFPESRPKRKEFRLVSGNLK